MDEGVLRSRALAVRIAQLPHRQQVAFAAGCAERALMVLEYEAFPGGPEFLPAFRAAVEAAWAAALGSPVPTAAVRDSVEAVFPTGDHYQGYDATVSAGCAVLAAVNAVDDPSGRAAADAALHSSSAYEQSTQWNDEPADDLAWQEQAAGLLVQWDDTPIPRDIFGSLPATPTLGGK